MYEDIGQYLDPSKCCLVFLKMTRHSDRQEGWENVKYGVRSVFYTTIGGEGLLTICVKNGAKRSEYAEVFIRSCEVLTFQECLQNLYANPKYAESLRLRIKYNSCTENYEHICEFLKLLPLKTWKEYKRLYRTLDTNTEMILRDL